MLNNNKLRRINEFEKAGIEVVAIGSEGTLNYSSTSKDDNEYCDQCSAFRLFPDPDPSDWFNDGNMKAVCLEVNGVIVGSLEKPNEFVNISKPLYCPKLGRELSEEEKIQAIKDLDWAKKRM